MNHSKSTSTAPKLSDSSIVVPEIDNQKRPIPKKIWLSSALPTLPATAVQLLEVSQNPDIEIKDVVRVVKCDPAITARLLRACNSAYYCFRSEITSLERAIPLLGLQSVTSLVLGFTLCDDALKAGPIADRYRAVWTQSLVQAVAAEALAPRCGDITSGVGFQMGLLLDIGALALLKVMPQEYLEICETAEEEQLPLKMVELRDLGYGHCAVGEKLAEKWRLPKILSLVIGRHEGDALEVASTDPVEDSYLQLAAMASSIGDYFCRPEKGMALNRIRTLISDGFPMEEAELDAIVDKIQFRIAECGDMFQFDCDELPLASEMMALANEQLSEIAFRAQLERATALQQRAEFQAENETLHRRQRQLVEESSRDALTCVFSRKFFEESISREISRCQREAASIGLLFIDIDHFKQFNDTHGHAVGDAVLKHVGQTIQAQLRGSDMAGRYGGEEFVVLINRPTRSALELVGERIRASVEKCPLMKGGIEHRVTVSVGAAIGIPDQQDNQFLKSLLETADAAMYEAKHTGRNKLCFKPMLSTVSLNP